MCETVQAEPWLNGTGGIYYNAGKVGIGTTGPGALLDVRGQIIGGFGSQTTAGALDWNHLSNSRPGSGYTLLYGNATNGPNNTGHYYHPFNFEYGGGKSGSGNITQLAIPYGDANSINSGLYIRGRYSSSWSSWRKILSEGPNGNVGIGTIVAGAKLEVRDDTDGNITALMLTSGDGSWVNGQETKVDFTQQGTPISRISSYLDTAGGSRWGFKFYGYNSGLNTTPVMTMKGDGNVGIGTTSPTGKLEVIGGSSGRITLAGTSNDTNANSPKLSFWGQGGTGNVSGPSLQAISTSSYGRHRLAIFQHDAGDYTTEAEVVTVLPSGNVGIGTTSPTSKLSVKGTIAAQEIKVVDTSGWADFVFDEGYQLPSLESVEAYIKKEKHLPDVPSAQRVHTDGLKVSVILAKQMQKLEEHTLYLIALKKENTALKRENERLKAEFFERLAALERKNQ